MTALSGFVWFILGALWVLGMLLAWMFMKALKKEQPDRMSDEWLEKRRRFKEDQ